MALRDFLPPMLAKPARSAYTDVGVAVPQATQINTDIELPQTDF